MGIYRVSTLKNAQNIIEIQGNDNKHMIIPAGQFNNPNLRDKLQTQANAIFGAGEVYVHVNRDDTIAIATGAAPDVWPEDEEVIE